ncbi:uncharacterized protein LOC108875247 [Lates japonicus]
MEDVVLHCQSGSAAGFSSLLETTEKLLEPFPRRTPPVFTPWFPAAADRRLPIRPARPAPVITSLADLLASDSRAHTHTTPTEPHLPENKPQKHDVDTDKRCDRPHTETTARPEETQHSRDVFSVSETPNHLLPASPRHRAERRVTDLPQKNTESPIKRSWSVFTQRGVLLDSSQSLSRRFHHMVSVHRLHLRQRAKWVISEDNCGTARDIEQVWRTLSRSVRSSRLPTCNANIQRERAEIWVFCDVLCSEQVGRFLKEELQLSGRISLSVHRLGNVFSM